MQLLGSSEDNAKKSDRKIPDVVKTPPAPVPPPSFDPSSTAGVVVIVVITCVVLTSLAWVLVIWRSRRSPAVVLALRRRSSVAFEAVANVRVWMMNTVLIFDSFSYFFSFRSALCTLCLNWKLFSADTVLFFYKYVLFSFNVSVFFFESQGFTQNMSSVHYSTFN